MEKPPKGGVTKIFRFLPRAASAVIAFQNLPFSPGKGKIGPSDRANHPLRFSGPLLPNKSFDELCFDGPEPTSPKISCMGQIKHKKSKIKKPHKDKLEDRPDAPLRIKGAKRGASKLRRIFSAKLEKRSGTSVGSWARDDRSRLPDRAPSLSQAKRFASGRDVLADFDWSAPFTPVDKELRNYYSDEEERRRTSDDRAEEEEEDYNDDKEEVMIQFSAPLPVGTRPRKEVNLWKRRTMAPPRPLQLHSTMATSN
ncbi:hypothetical protein MLD38_035013 [Melastoma candidum]|uniref:Uncharacterized protein n=1 Tax=Melastoma candidum TaxID=119954 RepID=A0ACB9MBV2_9MYRT|nr:hypothetical protein MLD38_035013 [Melastoma candidum]